MRLMRFPYAFLVTQRRAPTVRLDANDLRVVKAVGDGGSITRAAEALGYSQPAVSQHLAKLQSRLGVAVVERAGRTVRLTEAGRALARHAPAVTTALEAAAEEIDAINGLRSGTVRLVGFPSASPGILPRLVSRLASDHPGISVTYVEAEPVQAVEAVRADAADLALTFSYPGDRADPHRANARGLDVRSIGREDLVLVLPAAHPLAFSDVASVALLHDEEWIAGCPLCRGHLLEVCGRAGFAPRTTFETDNFVAVEGLVAQGLGVAVLPMLAVQSFPQLDGIVTRLLPPGDERTINLVAPYGAERVPTTRVVMNALAEITESLLRRDR